MDREKAHALLGKWWIRTDRKARGKKTKGDIQGMVYVIAGFIDWLYDEGHEITKKNKD